MGHCTARTAGDLFNEDKQAVDTKCVSRYPHVKPGYNQSLMAFLPLGEKTARKAALSHSKDITAPFGCNRMAALFSFKYSFLPKITLRGLSRCLFHTELQKQVGLGGAESSFAGAGRQPGTLGHCSHPLSCPPAPARGLLTPAV